MIETKKFFHDKYFARIKRMVQNFKFEQASYEFQKYLEIYPFDVYGLASYADILIRTNCLEEAEKVLKYTEILINDAIPIESKEEFIMIKFNLLCCKKEYQKAYDFFLEFEA